MGEIENYSGFNIGTYKVLRSHTNFFGELSPPKGYGGIYIEGDEIKEINSVRRIKGYLVLRHSTALSSLGSVRKIEGDFRMDAIQSTYVNDFDLGKLEEVDGKVDLNQRVSDLKNLKVVRGKIKANNSRIASFGNLIRVDGDIILNDILKGFIDNPPFLKAGKLRFWKRDYDIKNSEPTKIPSRFFGYNDIPKWTNKTINNHLEILNTNSEVQSFYRIFKENFLREKPIEIFNSWNFIYTLIYELKFQFQSKILSRGHFIKELKRIAFYYPICKYDIQEEIKSLFNSSNFESESLDLLSQLFSGKVKFNFWTLFLIDRGSDRDIILYEPELLSQAFTSTDYPLTKFGKENIQYIIKFFRELVFEGISNYQSFDEYSVVKRVSIWNEILVKFEGKIYLRNLAKYSNISSVKTFYSNIPAMKGKKEISEGIYVIGELSSFFSHNSDDWVLRDGIRTFLYYYLRKAEDVYRETKGLESIESSLIWKSENELFELISSAFPDEVAVQQSSPKWLGDQRFDIYLPHRNIAIEYQGIQHYEAIDFFGGNQGLKRTKDRDRRKKEKCKKNGCQLLIVDEGYRFDDVKEQLKLLISKSTYLEEVNYSQSAVPKYSETEVVRVEANTLIYDCKEQIEIKLSELMSKYPNLKVETFKNRNSYLKRYILSDSEEGEKVKESWKTIMDTYTGEKYRFNRIEFANFVNVPSNNVWNFFNGKQKLFHQRYRIL